MRFNNSNIDPNDQRLFPFVGGLVLGGVTGAAFSNNRFNQPYYYPYPIYPTYPMYYYPQNITPGVTNPQQVNIYNPYITDKIIYEDPIPLVFQDSNSKNDLRVEQKNNDFTTLKDVPIMTEYRCDML